MVFGRAALYRLPLLPTLTHSFITPSKISHLPCHSTAVPSFQIRAVNSESKLKEMTRSKDEGLSNTWKIKMLYDGECPLCMREAFRRLYEEVGLGWVYAITKYKPILTIANGIYGIWAAYRLQLTGRPSLEKILDSKKKLTERTCNDEKVCKM